MFSVTREACHEFSRPVCTVSCFFMLMVLFSGFACSTKTKLPTQPNEWVPLACFLFCFLFFRISPFFVFLAFFCSWPSLTFSFIYYCPFPSGFSSGYFYSVSFLFIGSWRLSLSLVSFFLRVFVFLCVSYIFILFVFFVYFFVQERRAYRRADEQQDHRGNRLLRFFEGQGSYRYDVRV